VHEKGLHLNAVYFFREKSLYLLVPELGAGRYMPIGGV
jgi:hypothetical protein